MAAVPPLTQSQTGPFYPGSQPFVVGTITLGTVECPAIIHFGKVRQTTVVTELTGGSRLVQTFGAQPQPLTISGKYWQNGSSVEERVADFLALAVAGAEILLTWSQQAYYGVITDFDPGFHNVARAEWSMTVEVTRDGNGALSQTVPPSLDTQVATLMANAATANAALLDLDFGPATTASTETPATVAYATGSSSPDVDPNATSPSWFQSALTNVQLAIRAASPLAAAAGTPANTALALALSSATLAVTQFANNQGSTSQTYSLSNQILTNLQLVSRNVAQGQSAISTVLPPGELVLGSERGSRTARSMTRCRSRPRTTR